MAGKTKIKINYKSGTLIDYLLVKKYTPTLIKTNISLRFSTFEKYPHATPHLIKTHDFFFLKNFLFFTIIILDEINDSKLITVAAAARCTREELPTFIIIQMRLPHSTIKLKSLESS